MKPIKLTGIFDRILTDETVADSWQGQIDRLTTKNNFTREAAERTCAIAEHISCIRLSEKVEYLTEIFELALPFELADKLSEQLKDWYR